jgi:hypothetical protein
VLVSTLEPPNLVTFFGRATCDACDAKVLDGGYALSWPGIAAGETKDLTFGLVATGAPGDYQWFAALYAKTATQVAAGPVGGGSGDLLGAKIRTEIVKV